MGSKLRVVSWVLLSLIGVLTLLGALASINVAYFSEDDQIGPVSLSELAGDRPDVATAIKARRGTAAAFATGYALLFLVIVLVPYRKGEVWAWWAILVGTLATTGIILLRVSMLDRVSAWRPPTYPSPSVSSRCSSTWAASEKVELSFDPRAARCHPK